MLFKHFFTFAMAPAKRAKGATKPPPSATPSKDEVKLDAKKRNALRKRQIKKNKRAKQLRAFKAAIRAAENPETKKELLAVEGQIYQPWKFGPRATAKLAKLEALVKKQHSEIDKLRRAKMAGAIGEEPDSSPVKIEEQLINDVASVKAGTIPSVEVEDVEQLAEKKSDDEQTAAQTTPSKPSNKSARGLSAESDANTPRTLRRSPRKRVEKQD